MARPGIAVVGLIAVLAGPAACSSGGSDVAPSEVASEEVTAADRPEATPSGSKPAGSGPAGSGPAQPPEPVIAWEAGNDTRYSMAPREAAAGQNTVELTCAQVPHNVTIEGRNGDEPVVECEAEGTFSGTVELEAGTYTYYCSVIGHRPGGMEGQFTVS